MILDHRRLGRRATSVVVFFALKATIGLRVSEEEEIEGLDFLEHGMAGYARDPCPSD